jgi:hypothetical protein
MDHNLKDTVALLARTPGALNVLLRDLPDFWTSRNEGADSWSVYDIIGHLIHGERTDWIQRTQIILQFGESRPFDRFDRTAQNRESQGKSLGDLLDEFARLRTENLQRLESFRLDADRLALRGRHPALGVVTLSQLLATWAAHDLTHLHQISRVMARQYESAVGPWTQFLGVMRCDGHSSP